MGRIDFLAYNNRMPFKRIHKKIFFVILAVFVLLISIASFYIDREALLETVGLENAYFLLFFVSATAGVSIFTATGFYIFFGAFIQLPVDPILSGVIAGLGVSLGDYIIFALARLATEGSRTLEKHRQYQKIRAFIERLPDWGVYGFTFIYTAFIPIPNDILMAILGALRFKMWVISVAMTLGNIVLMILIAMGVPFLFG